MRDYRIGRMELVALPLGSRRSTSTCISRRVRAAARRVGVRDCSSSSCSARPGWWSRRSCRAIRCSSSPARSPRWATWIIFAVIATLIAAALCGDNVELLDRALGRHASLRQAGSTRRTCSARTSSTSATAARPSSSRASCRSCAPTCRSWPGVGSMPYLRYLAFCVAGARHLGRLALHRGLLLRQHPAHPEQPDRRDPRDRGAVHLSWNHCVAEFQAHEEHF